MATRQDITNVIAYMKLVFPNYNPDVTSPLNTVDVLMDLLGDLSVEDLHASIKACCSEPGRAFAPSAGEIRGALAELRAIVNETPTAASAWAAIIESFQHSGPPSPMLENPVVKEAIKAMGGLHDIGYSEEINIERAHFLKMYEQLRTQAINNYSRLPALTNYIQQHKQLGEGVRMLTDRLAKC